MKKQTAFVFHRIYCIVQSDDVCSFLIWENVNIVWDMSIAEDHLSVQSTSSALSFISSTHCFTNGNLS